MSGDGGTCKKESGTITVPPTTSKLGTRVAGPCTAGGGVTITLYCAVGVGGGGGAGGSGEDGATLTAHYTCKGSDCSVAQADGPAVSSGCSTIIDGGKPLPEFGKCCFA